MKQMIRVVDPGPRNGCVRIPSSKSMAHRQLVIAALSEHPSRLTIDGVSDDIRATVDCLSALGAQISRRGDTLTVIPLKREKAEKRVILLPRESGTTLRFMLPLVGMLGLEAEIMPEGRLSGRPVKELACELNRHGMNISFGSKSIHASGKLQPGSYSLPGNVSSQYISALLLVLPLLSGDSSVTVTGTIESKGYIDLTLFALRNAGVIVKEQAGTYLIRGSQKYLPAELSTVEGDWSNAAFFLCMGALSRKGIEADGLNCDSRQGDRKIMDILSGMGACVSLSDTRIYVKKGCLNAVTLDVSQIPDLVPAVSVLMALADGESRITNAYRLRLKESDRLSTTCAFLRALGAEAALDGNDILIRGRPMLTGGEADACGDHRIAMALALAASGCGQPVTIKGADAVNKSFPDFFTRLDSLEEEK